MERARSLAWMQMCLKDCNFTAQGTQIASWVATLNPEMDLHHKNPLLKPKRDNIHDNLDL